MAMIEPTDEMRTALLADYEDACDVVGCGRDDCLNTRLAAVLVIFVQRIEGPRDVGLCDCGGYDEPVSPRTGEPMDHHCDCRAVETAAVLLGDASRTRHAAACVCQGGAS